VPVSQTQRSAALRSSGTTGAKNPCGAVVAISRSASCALLGRAGGLGGPFEGDFRRADTARFAHT